MPGCMAQKEDGSGFRGWIDDVKENAWGYVVLAVGVVVPVSVLITLAINADTLFSDVRAKARAPSNPNPESGLIYQYRCDPRGRATMVIFEGDVITNCNAIGVPLSNSTLSDQVAP